MDEADYSGCWANPLGDCSGGMTGEHHISRNQFGDGTVTVRGFSWCRDEPRTIGVDRLVAKVLCAHHNNGSSDLDAAAGDTLQALGTIAERQERRRAGRPLEERKIFRIPGDKLERWLLKTTINLALQRKPAPVGGIFDISGRPARRFIEIVYGRAFFEREEGLFWVAEKDEIIEARHGRIQFEPWMQAGNGALVSAFMRFHGHRLWLATVGAPTVHHGLHPMRTFLAPHVRVRIEFEYSQDRNRIFRGQPPRLRRT